MNSATGIIFDMATGHMQAQIDPARVQGEIDPKELEVRP